MWTAVLILALALLLILLGLAAVITITFFMRGTPVRRVRLLDHDGRWLPVSEERFCRTFTTLTNTTVHSDNAVRILANGDGTYPELWRALEAAEDLITWHVFWFKPGRLADRVADILERKARAGVTVLFLYDYFGSMGMDDTYYDRLREAGVEVKAFRAPRWHSLYKFQQRMHVRAVVIDGRVGFTGGFAVDDHWAGDGRRPGQWRDTSLRLEGPIVRQLQTTFASNWAETCGELLVGERVFPPVAEPAGQTVSGLMYHAPSLGSTNAERYFMLTIAGADDRLYISNPYFVPNRRFRNMLIAAVDRGVDVRVLTPGRNNDRMSAHYASMANYEELLAGGVRIYHYRPTMMHAKTLVADGVWCSVGTVNFDNRSMVLNDEVAVVMQDRTCGQRLERLFFDDLEHADEVDLDEVRKRGLAQRVKEKAYGAFSPLL